MSSHPSFFKFVYLFSILSGFVMLHPEFHIYTIISYFNIFSMFLTDMIIFLLQDIVGHIP
jgi:hypothetical protein